jgi:hypothetical protein
MACKASDALALQERQQSTTKPGNLRTSDRERCVLHQQTVPDECLLSGPSTSTAFPYSLAHGCAGYVAACQKRIIGPNATRRLWWAPLLK